MTLPEQRYASPTIFGWVRSLEGVSARHKAVLYALATFCDDNTEDARGGPKRYATCYPSQQSLAIAAGLSVRSVRRVLEELDMAGLIEVWPHAGGTEYLRADRRPNLYRLVGPEPRPDAHDRADAHDRSSEVARPVTAGTTTGHQWSNDRSQVAAEEVIDGSDSELLKNPGADEDAFDQELRISQSRPVSDVARRSMREARSNLRRVNSRSRRLDDAS